MKDALLLATEAALKLLRAVHSLWHHRPTGLSLHYY